MKEPKSPSAREPKPAPVKEPKPRASKNHEQIIDTLGRSLTKGKTPTDKPSSPSEDMKELASKTSDRLTDAVHVHHSDGLATKGKTPNNKRNRTVDPGRKGPDKPPKRHIPPKPGDNKPRPKPHSTDTVQTEPSLWPGPPVEQASSVIELKTPIEPDPVHVVESDPTYVFESKPTYVVEPEPAIGDD